MKLIEQVFGVLLTSKEFSVAEITAFGTDHEARLIANNPEGVFDELVAGTASALDAVSTSTGREATAEAVQKARTSAKVKVKAEITEAISNQSGLVTAKFGRNSPTYLEFFPRGLTEVHQARESEIPEILQRLIDAADANLPELKPVFTDFSTRWDAVSGEATTRRAARASTAEARSDAMQDLRVQLTRNLLTLALHFLGQPEKSKVYFNTSLLYNRTRSTGTADSGVDPSPTPETATQETNPDPESEAPLV